MTFLTHHANTMWIHEFHELKMNWDYKKTKCFKKNNAKNENKNKIAAKHKPWYKKLVLNELEII